MTLRERYTFKGKLNLIIWENKQTKVFTSTEFIKILADRMLQPCSKRNGEAQDGLMFDRKEKQVKPVKQTKV